MYNVEKLKTNLFSLIGWRQNPNPGGTQLTEMTTSDSSIWYNDQHPLLTFDNMYSVSPDFDLRTYPTYDGSKIDYVVGDVVGDTSDPVILYERIKVSTSAEALTNTEFWKKHSAFTKWLREKTESGIIDTIDDWYNQKSGLATAINLLSRETIFQDGGDFEDTQDKKGKVVGQYLYPRRSEGVIMTIHKISLQLTQNQSVTVKLFKKGTKTPIVSETFVYDQNGSVQWFTPTEPTKWVLSGGNTYFIGYNEDDILGNAINAIENCHRIDYFPTGKFYNIRSFNVDSDFTEMWNESKVLYNTSTNYGLNYKIDVSCDYTDFIIEQKHLFQKAISKRVAMKVLREFPFNANALVNRHVSNIEGSKVLYEIDGDTQGAVGNNTRLNKQYEKALNAIQFDRSGIDPICLKCRKRGISYSTIRGNGRYKR